MLPVPEFPKRIRWTRGPFDLVGSEVGAGLADAQAEAAREAMKKGIGRAEAKKKERVEVVHEDEGLGDGKKKKKMTQAEAQLLYDEVMRNPDSPFAYFFRKEFLRELERRYPDVEEENGRVVRFLQEVRAKWWYSTEVRGQKLTALVKNEIYVNQPDTSLHSLNDVGKYFSVPEDFFKHFWKAQDLAPPKKFDDDADEMIDEDRISVVLRNFNHPYEKGEFKYSQGNRMMIREDGLKLASILEKIRTAIAPNLQPAYAPAGVLARPVDEAEVPSAVKPTLNVQQKVDTTVTKSDQVMNQLNRLLGRSNAEFELEKNRYDEAFFSANKKVSRGNRLPVELTSTDWYNKAWSLNASQLLRSVFILDGLGHAGRSSIANYAALSARQKNWFVLHIPRFDLMCNGPWLICPSESSPGKFDQPLLAWNFFKDIFHFEGERLKQIKLKLKYEGGEDLAVQGRHPTYFTQSEEAFAHFQSNEDSTLYDLVSFACTHRIQASRLFISFLTEVNQINELPVLVIIDGVNAYNATTGYFHNETAKPLPADNLTIPSALYQFVAAGPQNGVSIVCKTGVVTGKNVRLPRLEKTKRFIFPVLPYSESELRNCVLHYAVNGYFQFPVVDRQFFGEISVATNRLPLKVHKFCKFLGIE